MFRAAPGRGRAPGCLHPHPCGAQGTRGGAPACATSCGAMTSLLLVSLPVVVALGIFAAPWLVHLFAAKFAADPREVRPDGAPHQRLMFPYLGLISLAALAQGVLNASGQVPASSRDAHRPQPLHRGRDRHRGAAPAADRSGWRSASWPVGSRSSRCSGRCAGAWGCPMAARAGLAHERRGAAGAGRRWRLPLPLSGSTRSP